MSDYVASPSTNEVLGSILNSLTHKYEVSLDELRNIDEADVETRTRERAQKVRDIAMDIALDLTILAKYRLGQDTKYQTYYMKHLEAAIKYLQDLRQTLTLYLSSERL